MADNVINNNNTFDVFTKDLYLTIVSIFEIYKNHFQNIQK